MAGEWTTDRLSVVAALIVAEGWGSSGAACSFLASAPVDWFASLASAAIGTFSLFKAYGLWSFHP